MAIDVAITAAGSSDAPLPYSVPGAQEIIVKSCYASFDGTGAGGNFLPVIQFLSPAGQLVATAQAPMVAAGASADVSFFPHVASAASSAGSGIQFDTDNEGGWLEVTTNDVIPSGPNAGYGMALVDTGSLPADAGILIAAAADVLVTTQGSQFYNAAGTNALQGDDVAITATAAHGQLTVSGNGAGAEVSIASGPHDKLCFFLAPGSAVPQQARPATLAEVIALLVAYGLSA